MKTLLLVGGCGSGKTWVLQKLIEEHDLNIRAKIKAIEFRTNKKLAILGKYSGGTFDGSDRLSMSVMKDAPLLRQVQKKHNLVIVCEGDRFMNSNFIKRFEPFIIKIEDEGASGREKRGSEQTARQIKSIATRVSNIKEDKLVANSGEALVLANVFINESSKSK